MSSTARLQPERHDVGDVAFVIGLLAIVALGLFARFYGLSDQPIWMDEAYSYFASTRPLADILFNKIDTHPPLFYAIQHFWTAIDPKFRRFARRRRRLASAQSWWLRPPPPTWRPVARGWRRARCWRCLRPIFTSARTPECTRS